jgi:hypothetical protein
MFNSSMVITMGGKQEPINIHERIKTRGGIEYYRYRGTGHSIQFWGECSGGFVNTVQMAWWFETNDKFDQIKQILKNNVRRKDNGCYEWVGQVDKNGRGYMHVAKCFRSVNQAIADAYFFGEFLSDLKHKTLRPFMTCKDKSCCNPLHMKFFDTEDKKVVELYFVKQFQPLKDWRNHLTESGEWYLEKCKKGYLYLDVD